MYNFSIEEESWEAFNNVSPRLRAKLSLLTISRYASIFSKVKEIQEMILVTEQFLNSSIREVEFRYRLKDIHNNFITKLSTYPDSDTHYWTLISNAFLYIGLGKYSVTSGYQFGLALMTLMCGGVAAGYSQLLPDDVIEVPLQMFFAALTLEWQNINRLLESFDKSLIKDLFFEWRN